MATEEGEGLLTNLTGKQLDALRHALHVAAVEFRKNAEALKNEGAASRLVATFQEYLRATEELKDLFGDADAVQVETVTW